MTKRANVLLTFVIFFAIFNLPIIYFFHKTTKTEQISINLSLICAAKPIIRKFMVRRAE